MLIDTPMMPTAASQSRSSRVSVVPRFFRSDQPNGASTSPPMRKRKKVIWIGSRLFPATFSATSMVPKKNAVRQT